MVGLAGEGYAIDTGRGMCYGAFVKMVIVPKRVCSSEGTSICKVGYGKVCRQVFHAI